MVNARYQMADVLDRQEAVIRDALDGRIDDQKGFAAYIREAKEAHAALGEMLARAETEKDGKLEWSMTDEYVHRPK
jgi:uncharacterized membrane protein YccC